MNDFINENRDGDPEDLYTSKYQENSWYFLYILL
jgi:hypothetical protein